MNPKKLMYNARSFASVFTIPVFVENAYGKADWGTGLLLNFRGHHFVVTCKHVVATSSDGIVYFGKETRKWIYQDSQIHENRFDFDDIDFVAFLMSSEFVPQGKHFFAAANAILQDIGQDVLVIVHGYPAGRSGIQQGCVEKEPRQLLFSSATYVAHTKHIVKSTRLNREQPTIRWAQKEMLDYRSFEALPTSASLPFIGQGFSGAPVFTQKERRLVGFVTDTDKDNDRWLMYIPISEALDRLDRII